jgi:tRNA-dihydrouridine synthase A
MFHRAFSQRVWLYTEMVTAAAVIHGPKDRLLGYSDGEHPVVLQLGGSDPAELATAVRLAAPYGYDEINLNVGCPSDRVQSGCFGAVLMLRPALVAACVAAMQDASPVPVTVKCRLGADDQTPADTLPEFLRAMQGAGVGHVIIHARKAWLSGLSPKENREIPPLDYDLVRAMKREFPCLRISINGGITTLAQAQSLLARDEACAQPINGPADLRAEFSKTPHRSLERLRFGFFEETDPQTSGSLAPYPDLDFGLDGVMVGRAAYHAPASVLKGADGLWGDAYAPDTMAVIETMRPYIAAHLAAGGRLHQITRHMLGAFTGQPGARGWRRVLSTQGMAAGAGLDVLDAALAEVTLARAVDAPPMTASE